MINKIREGIQPTSYTDTIARQHDVDFIKADGIYDRVKADVKAIGKSFNDISLQSIALRAGLTARTFLDVASLGLINFNKKDYSYNNKEIGQELQNIIDEENDY